MAFYVNVLVEIVKNINNLLTIKQKHSHQNLDLRMDPILV